MEVYEEPVSRTKQIPHCPVECKANEENRIAYERNFLSSNESSMHLHTCNSSPCYTLRQCRAGLDRLIGFMTDGRLSGFLDILDQRIRLIKLSPNSSSSLRIIKEDVSFTECSSFNSDRLQRLKHVSCHRN